MPDEAKPVPAVVTPVESPQDGITIAQLFSEGWQRFLSIKLTTHLLAAASVAAAGMWQDPAFQAQIVEIFKSMPHWIQSVVVESVFLYAVYKRTHKQ